MALAAKVALPLGFPMGNNLSAAFVAAQLWKLAESPWASSCREKCKLEKSQALCNLEGKKKELITAYMGAPFLPNFSAYLSFFGHSLQNIFMRSDYYIA